jgi:hypothetical protein
MQDMTRETEQPDTSSGDVIYVLLLLQGAMALLSGVAMLLFMQGNPFVLPIAVGTPALLFVVAAGVARNRRWARRVAIVVESLILAGFAISLLIGVLPQIDFSINLLTLITNLALPVTVIRLLRRSRVVADAPARSAEVTSSHAAASSEIRGGGASPVLRSS